MNVKVLTRTTSILALFALAGCATPAPSKVSDAPSARPPKVVSFDGGPMREIVETPRPYPLPGQLKPLEDEAAPTPLQPAARIDTANARAKVEPDLDRFLNAVQVYPFMDGALYRLYGAPEQVTDIALEPGEKLNSVSAGDTVRWIVGDTSSGGRNPVGADGARSPERVHILVKPIAPGLKTNLVIATDRRAYHLEMRSFRDTYMAAISWTYPQDDLLRRRIENDRTFNAADTTVAIGVDPGALKFRYAIEGDRPSWRPLRAFDDGRQVFIEFPETIAQGEAPPLFVLSRKGAVELVNYRLRGRYYVVDRLFQTAELRLGEKDQDIVRIRRTDLGARERGR